MKRADSFSGKVFLGSRPEKLNNCKYEVFRVFGEFEEKSKLPGKLVTDGQKSRKTSKIFSKHFGKIEITRKGLSDGRKNTQTIFFHLKN